LHLVLGFSAGAVIGVGVFDLLPEALELGASIPDDQGPSLVAALGFVAYLVLDAWFFISAVSRNGDDESPHALHGTLGAGSLSGHSFLEASRSVLP